MRVRMYVYITRLLFSLPLYLSLFVARLVFELFRFQPDERSNALNRVNASVYSAVQSARKASGAQLRRKVHSGCAAVARSLRALFLSIRSFWPNSAYVICQLLRSDLISVHAPLRVLASGSIFKIGQVLVCTTIGNCWKYVALINNGEKTNKTGALRRK